MNAIEKVVEHYIARTHVFSWYPESVVKAALIDYVKRVRTWEHPSTIIDQIDDDELQAIHQDIKQIMEKSVSTNLEDFLYRYIKENHVEELKDDAHAKRAAYGLAFYLQESLISEVLVDSKEDDE